MHLKDGIFHICLESPWLDLQSLMISSNVIVNSNGPSGNVPAVTVDGTVIDFDVCEVSSCENNHPVVTVEITLSARVIGVRGSFSQVPQFLTDSVRHIQVVRIPEVKDIR